MNALETIRHAAREHRTVLLTAREKDGSIESREAEPYSIRPAKNGPRLFYWCHTRNALRSTQLTNIVDARPTNRTFSPRWTIEL
jgi:predicted DNA-binding transcriptional regulator YafY